MAQIVNTANDDQQVLSGGRVLLRHIRDIHRGMG